jgi:hypothetical protein
MMTVTLTLDPVASPAQGVPFTITGTLTVSPSLSFKDDGGSAQAAAVPDVSERVSFTHPGLNVGSHVIVVSDPVSGASASATVASLGLPDGTFSESLCASYSNAFGPAVKRLILI